MDRYPVSSRQLAELDNMIARAEAASERYRRSAEEPGLTHLAARMRCDAHRAMVKTLARLQRQRQFALDRMRSLRGNDPAFARRLRVHVPV
jgi:hypothetical protein